MTKRTIAKYDTFHIDEENADGDMVKVPIPVFYNKGINVEDTELYFVYLLREVNALTNMLLAMLYYKNYVGQAWPRSVALSYRSRFLRYGLNLGEEISLKYDMRFRVMDAIYMSLYGPIPDLHDDKRVPTLFDGKRKSADNPENYPILFHRNRKTVKVGS